MKRHRATAALTLPTALLAGACAARAADAGPHKEPIRPPGATTVAPYTPAIRTGDLVFLSGQVGLLPGTRDLAPGGVAGQTRQALENVRAVLAAAGLAPADVVKCTVFLVDIDDYAAMNEVYGEFFGDTPPARSAIAVNALPVGAQVEIECIAAAR